MMRVVATIFLTLGACAAHAAAPHYVMRAGFDPQGRLDADVTITLTEALPEKAFLLSRRFNLQPMKLPRGVTMTVKPSATAIMPELNEIVFRFAKPSAQPVKLRFRYSGPINTVNDSGAKPMRDEGFELFIDHMWFPVGADIQTRFTLDAEIDGLAPDLVVVAQGRVERTAAGVRIRRDFIDIDVPMVAMRGLKRVEAPGVEFFSRDLSTRLSGFLAKHAEGAGRYFQNWFGPLKQPVRMALVWRQRSMGYARAGYTVMSEGGRDGPDVAEGGPARYVAHEVAHAWWMLASPLTEDFWLVESVAEYLALRYGEVALGTVEIEKVVEAKRKEAATAGPVIGHGRPSRPQLYVKGPILLVDLEKRIGRPAMDSLLTAMSKEPVHTTAVFLRLLAGVAGEAAARDFERTLRA